VYSKLLAKLAPAAIYVSLARIWMWIWAWIWTQSLRHRFELPWRGLSLHRVCWSFSRGEALKSQPGGYFSSVRG